MEVSHFKVVARAGLCISLPIKVWRFRRGFGGFGVPLGLLNGARIIEFHSEKASTLRAAGIDVAAVEINQAQYPLDCGARKLRHSEGEAGAELGREGDTHSGAGAEEIAEGAGGDAQLIQAGDGLRLRAGGIQAERGGVRQIVHRSRKRGEIRDVIRAGIVAVEKVEELDEGRGREALPELERAANAHIDLDVRRAAKLIHGGLHAVDDGAIIDRITDSVYVNGSGDGEWARAFEL